MKVVDTRGLICPAPLIKTRQGLTEAEADEPVQVIIDNQTSLGNIKRYLTDNGLAFSVREEGGVWLLTVAKAEAGAEVKAKVEAEAEVEENLYKYCRTAGADGSGRRNTVVAVTSEKMGSGDDELGLKLMSTFFKMLVLMEPPPASVVFYNAGVKLATGDSPVFVYIRELADKGTGIYLCTTCINHFSLKDRLPVGSFSDMYQIINILRDADHIIRP